jgi:NADH-quinone oxidoreductase subunit C
MPLEPAITDLEQLKDRPAVAALLASHPDAVQGAKFDRGELTLYVERSALRAVCETLRDGATAFNFLVDVTCIDLLPSEPRFEVKYHLLSHTTKERVRLTVRLNEDDANVDSLVPLWPSADFYEREVFDLFGVRFAGHPNLVRIMLPEDWQGYPLRKDYPVEGFR